MEHMTTYALACYRTGDRDCMRYCVRCTSSELHLLLEALEQFQTESKSYRLDIQDLIRDLKKILK